MSLVDERKLVFEVADQVGGLMEFWGFKRVMGRAWTTLYLHGEAMTAAELCERMEISTGAASTTLTELERWGVVLRTRRSGDRRDFFTAENDVWKMISRVLREREILLVDRALEVFERAQEDLAHVPAGERVRAQAVMARIEKLAELARVGRALLTGIIERGHADLAPLMRFASALVRKRA
ncbi:MAG: MarR family transcriptional regulator [Deltaproteobacteria bacterium]|nr:MarR family transcriptional regulator [Deltaproteobacteria bacterium]